MVVVVIGIVLSNGFDIYCYHAMHSSRYIVSDHRLECIHITGSMVIYTCYFIFIFNIVFKGVAIGNDFNVSTNRDNLYSSIDSRRQIVDNQQVTYKVARKCKGRNMSGMFLEYLKT